MSPTAITRRLERGRWERVLPKVYKIGGAPETWAQHQMALCLWAGPDAAAGRRAAAALLRLDGFEQATIEVTSPRKVVAPGRGLVVYQTSGLRPFDIASVRGIPTTRPWLTLMQLGSVATVGDVEMALEAALRRGLVSVPYLRKMLGRRARRGVRGTAALRKLVDERPDDYRPTGNAGEVKLRQVIKRYALPMPVGQFEMVMNGRIYRPDFAYPQRRLAIECQSIRWHGRLMDYKKDMPRHNEFSAIGWRVLYFDWHQLCDEQDYVAATIRRALAEPF